MRSCLLALAGLAAPAAAQTCAPLVDLGVAPQPLSSFPFTSDRNPLVPFQGGFLFPGWTVADGLELWFTDGVSAHQVKDIHPGPAGSLPEELVVWNGWAYFFADDGVHGRELWKTDGSPQRTVLVADKEPGPLGSTASDLLALDDQLVFLAKLSGTFREIWVSDGTAAGTQPLVQTPGAAVGQSPTMLRALADGKRFMYFALHPTGGLEPWASDGSEAGTQFLVDAVPGAGASSFGLVNALPFAGGAVFGAGNGQVEGAYFTDGTAAGTVKLANLALPKGQAGEESFGAELGGTLYFVATGAGVGQELFRTDGTPAGTALAFDALPGPTGSQPSDLVALGGELFYFASTGVPGERALFATQGTLATTRTVKVFAGENANAPDQLRRVGARLYFSAVTAATGREPWTSDGTPAGTLALGDFASGGAGSVFAGVRALAGDAALLVMARDATGFELNRTDGTPAGTTLAFELESGVANAGSSPHDMTVMSGTRFVFAGELPGFGGEPLIYDATAGVSLLADVEPGLRGSDPAQFTWVATAAGPRLFFEANRLATGRELWVSDGTAAGTHAVADLWPGTLSSALGDFTAAPGRLYFTANDGVHGRELWTSDGTPAGTVMVRDINPAAGIGSVPRLLRWMGDHLLFSANDGPHGNELWRSDGTPAGTHMVVELHTSGSANIRALTRVGAEAAFVAFDNLTGFQYSLWKTDGTAAGTVEVAQLDGFLFQDPKAEFAVLDGRVLLFGLDAQGSNMDLWISDLTPAGTFAFASIAPVGPDNVLQEVVRAGDRFVFTVAGADSTSVPNRLYATDGTAAGTVTLSTGGSVVHFARDLVAVGSRVYFTGREVLGGGEELFVIDGNSIALVCDVSPGSSVLAPGVDLSSKVEAKVAWGDQLLFAASAANTVGRELFVTGVSGGHATDLGLAGGALQLAATQPLIGQALTLTGAFGDPGAVVWLAWSPPVQTASSALVAPGFALWLDPAQAHFAGSFAGTPFTKGVSIPAQPGLVGARLHVQAGSFDPLSAAFRTSNGLLLVLGD